MSSSQSKMENFFFFFSWKIFISPETADHAVEKKKEQKSTTKKGSSLRSFKQCLQYSRNDCGTRILGFEEESLREEINWFLFFREAR